MIEKNIHLEDLLEAMIADNETISARAIVRRSGDVFKHATDITRNETRRAMFEQAVKKQEAIRSAVERSSKKSRAELERLVATKNAEIERLQNENNLLIASHRAMILSVAEMGGFSTWKRFFERYQSVVDTLEGMGSLPEADIISFPLREGI
jgi:hypothetical protein